MSKLEALDRIFKWNLAYQAQSILGMVEAVGLTQDLVEDMDGNEIMEAMQVRLADMARLVGTPLVNPGADQ
jgi:ABC-type phosphate/phosphonate transport system permease subunit